MSARVALSSLNRAATGAREGYAWINAVALALSVLIARMSIGAYEQAGTPDKAWICVTCQGLAIALAILGRRALTGQMPASGIAAMLGAGGCSWWASHGLAMAWAAGGDSANEWMVFFLTALEPALFLLAEHVREGREALRVAQAKEDAEMAEVLAANRERENARWGPRLATSGGAVLASAPMAANAAELAPMLAHPVEHPAIVSTNVGYASAREHAIALKRANGRMTQAQISSEVSAPRSTVGKWLRDAGLAA